MALTLSIHHLPSVPSRELYLLLLSQAGFNTQSAGASAKNLLMSTISHDVTRVRFKAVTDERWVLEPWAEYQIPKFNFYPGTTPPSTSLHEYFRNLTSLAIESHLLSKGVVVRSGGIQVQRRSLLQHNPRNPLHRIWMCEASARRSRGELKPLSDRGHCYSSDGWCHA